MIKVLQSKKKNGIKKNGITKTGFSFLEVSTRQKKSIDIFFNGIIFFTISNVGSNLNLFFSASVWQAFQAIGIVMMVGGAAGLIRFKFENKYLESVFTIYLLLSLTVILRVQKFDYNSLKSLFFDVNFTILIYLTPLVLLFPQSFELYKKIFRTCFIFGCLSLFFVFYYYDILADPSWLNRNSQGMVELYFFSFVLPSGIILLTFYYHSKNIKWFVFIILIIALYFLIFRARRASLFICITTLAGAGMVYLIHTKRKVLVVFLSVFFVLVSSVFTANIKLPSMFDFLMSRKDDDTRTGVEVAMKADMKPLDWIIGKGINGTYYYPYVVDDPSDLSGQRRIVETGYLQTILKSGVLSIVLLLFMLLPGIYWGLFKSNNVLCKGAGMFNLLWVIYNRPTIVNNFSIFYILVWICAGICYSSKIRNMSDFEIKKGLAIK